MGLRFTTVLLLALVLLLLALAHAPLLQAGLLADDYAHLIGVPRIEAERSLPWLWTRASQALWGIPRPGASAWPLRLENLLVLLGAALCLRAFCERLLTPWTGAEQARTGAAFGALLFSLHPLTGAAIARLEARGELLGLFLCCASAALFLRGRQQGRYALTSSSAGLCLLAACSAPSALSCPFILAGAEYFSAHRYRRRALRLRTALTTLAVFGAAALLPLLSGSALGGTTGLTQRAFSTLSSWAAVRRETSAAIEELGLLVLPANPEVLGASGSVLAGALFLLALRPAFQAARNAPRLWGGVLLSWMLALWVVLLWHPATRATPDSFDQAWSALPAVLLVSAGLGLTATALAGQGNQALCALIALGLACLAHANARPWISAASELARLRVDLLPARALAREAPLLVLDPPLPIAGVDPLHGSLAWLLHPALEGRADPFVPARVRGLSTKAFLALIREAEFGELRRQSPVVLLAPGAPGGAATGAGREALALGPGEPSGAVRGWRQALRSPALDLDPLGFEALRAGAGLESAPAELEVLGWRTKGVAAAASGSARGVVFEEGGGRTALFDLSRSLAWRLGGRIRLAVFEQGIRPIDRADFLEELPSLGAGLEPRSEGADWIFALPAAGTVASRPGGSFVLTLLALADYQCREILVDPESPGALRARGAELFAQRPEARALPLAWSLDYRIDDLAIARARGRRP